MAVPDAAPSKRIVRSWSGELDECRSVKIRRRRIGLESRLGASGRRHWSPRERAGPSASVRTVRSVSTTGCVTLRRASRGTGRAHRPLGRPPPRSSDVTACGRSYTLTAPLLTDRRHRVPQSTSPSAPERPRSWSWTRDEQKNPARVGQYISDRRCRSSVYRSTLWTGQPPFRCRCLPPSSVPPPGGPGTVVSTDAVVVVIAARRCSPAPPFLSSDVSTVACEEATLPGSGVRQRAIRSWLCPRAGFGVRPLDVGTTFAVPFGSVVALPARPMSVDSVERPLVCSSRPTLDQYQMSFSGVARCAEAPVDIPYGINEFTLLVPKKV